MCFEDGIPLNIYRLIHSCQWTSLQALLITLNELFCDYVSIPFRYFRLAIFDRTAMAYELYRYNAEASAALLAAGFFCLILTFSAYRMYTTRSWFMCISIVAIIMEIIGLLTRSLSILQPQNFSAFVASTILLTLAPSVQAASLYMLGGRVIRQSTPSDKQDVATLWFQSQYLTVTFIAQNILAIAIQLFGIGYFISAITAEVREDVDPIPELQRAMHVLVFGFSFQILTLIFFLILTTRFQIKSFDWLPQLKGRGLSEKMVRTIFYVLYLSTVLLMIRTLYRLNQFVAETTLSSSFLVTQEWPFWVFEIFVVSLIYASYLVPQYPGRWFERGGPLENGFETTAGPSKAKQDIEMGTDGKSVHEIRGSVREAYGEFKFDL
ncbi:hypothetical protein TWF225_007432 [Orbilia oligospora]|nr:hypothetical protein TWF225_007432 [Orbilia oligospora]KAF3241921.1 hypothetical protein TWF128_010644 [Orbilia oligospora]KAF3252228.1 hypothetical protein TWF217_007770 [Orbilia oligospora]